MDKLSNGNVRKTYRLPACCITHGLLCLRSDAMVTAKRRRLQERYEEEKRIYQPGNCRRYLTLVLDIAVFVISTFLTPQRVCVCVILSFFPSLLFLLVSIVEKAMLNTFAWIFIACIIVCLIVIVFLLFFTRSPIELPLSVSADDSDFEEWLVESEEQVASLPEDARLSYERAKGKANEKEEASPLEWSLMSI